MTLLIIILSILYFLVMVSMALIFNQMKDHTKGTSEFRNFSVVIPFRNETPNLPALIDSLSQLRYPATHIEFIFCNDHSTDESPQLLQKLLLNFPFPNRVLDLPITTAGKKAALTLAIENSKYEYIITSDADCKYNPDWIRGFNEILVHTNYKMVLGPVVYATEKNAGIIEVYQSIENAGLIMIGAASLAMGRPFMANGANLCFAKDDFFTLNGYAGNEHIASGDDEFLLQKFNTRYPNTIAFLKNPFSIVYTAPQPHFKAMVNQRVRWASKAKFHQKKSVFIIQLTMLIFFLGLALNPFFNPGIWAILPIGIKLAADLISYQFFNLFFKLPYPVLKQIAVGLLQIIFTPLIGILSVSKNYTWQDRKYHA